MARSEREPTVEDEQKAIDTATCSLGLRILTVNLGQQPRSRLCLRQRLRALREPDANCLLLYDTAGRSGRPAEAAVNGGPPNRLPLR
ncbi:hypothetical protein MTO96_012855 [Rhipicephalus appendiculatus]